MHNRIYGGQNCGILGFLENLMNSMGEEQIKDRILWNPPKENLGDLPRGCEGPLKRNYESTWLRKAITSWKFSDLIHLAKLATKQSLYRPRKPW